MPLPVTLDPIECKNLIKRLNGTNNKILNNIHYNESLALLVDHYFQEKSEQYQTPSFTVNQLNKMYTGTFTFLDADKHWIYDSSRNLYHNCPAHHRFEVNLVNWRIEVFEIELTYDDTENVMLILTDTLFHAILQMVSVNQLLRLRLLLFGLAMIFFLNFYITKF